MAQDKFVHAKRDGGRGHRAQEMRGQAAIEGDQAFFLPDDAEALS